MENAQERVVAATAGSNTLISFMLSQSAQQARALFMGASRIHCICHRNPDGDALGSLLGIALLLEAHVPGVTVLRVCLDPAPESLDFLPGVVRLRSTLTLQEGDAAIVLDAAEPKLTGLHESHPQLFNGSVPLLMLDHHPRKDAGFGTVNIVESSWASTCEIVAALAQALDWSIDPDAATCLLTGIYTDTGGLLHSNTSARVYRTVADLLRRGARQQAMVAAVFRTAKLSTLRLWGRVLERISLSDDGGAIAAVTQADFRATGAHPSELTGAIDYVNAIPGMRFSLILSERDGLVKGSLRTLRDDVDVAAMAGKFQGGGHKKAAGFSVPGSLQPELRWKVVPSTPQEAPLPQAPSAPPGAPQPA